MPVVGDHKGNGYTKDGYVAAPPNNKSTQRATSIDGIDGKDGIDGSIARDGALGAKRYIKPNGPNWWTREESGLLGKVFCYLADYVILPETSLLVVSVWVLASYLAELWDRFPHLAITSPEGRCGKTRLLELLEVICRASWMLTSPTPAVIFRKIAKERPTILYDEAQALNRGDSENATMIYELFCAGISKTSSIPRCVGPNHDPSDFPIYCPKALALIGKLKGILADRCINVLMKRKNKDERTKRSRMRDWSSEGAVLSLELMEWAESKIVQKRVKGIYDDLDLFDIDNDRMAELLLPLQAVLVAEYGDDSYPLRMLKRYADGIQEMDREAERLSPGVRLLVACKEIFAEHAVNGFLQTESLLRRLHERTEEPWADYRNGNPLNSEGLSALLRQYDIKPKRNKTQTARGYFQVDFRDSWNRYTGDAPSLPINPSKPSKPSNPSMPKRSEGGRKH